MAARAHNPTSPLLFMGIVVGVFAASLAVAGQLPRLERATAVAIALTMDMVAVVPLSSGPIARCLYSTPTPDLLSRPERETAERGAPRPPSNLIYFS